MLADLVSELEAVMVEPGSPGFAPRFEGLVGQIAEIDDPGSIEALMRFLDDRVDDELLFSIVHTIERFDDQTYADHLLAGLPRVAASSPRWARILLLRVLNSPPTLAALRARLGSVSGAPAAALRETLRGLMAWRPEFTERAEDLLARLN